MVAKITVPLSISRALNYNEQKVQKGKAECLFAANFLHHASELNFYQKLGRFEKRIEQNSSKTNTLHISLNFHPTELLPKEKLIEIAETYMHKIGFGEQPFLVYQHFDAGHPHLHIVTTTIKEDGRRIDTYNLGRNQSEKARKEIEEAYGLVKAGGKNNPLREHMTPIYVQRVRYGVAETKRSIATVVNLVINQYRYTSLAELNAVLKLYNVT
ncbi:MAG: relaxase/mobilization nuclease domain-containing protein, partial [Flavisolibacter sp.]|nr:relaxase/mobilization nuclease domain-containing protein [Flavisolibacter sp.]